MSTSPALPNFARPPVVETILGVQFDTIVGFSAHHFGWFWKDYLAPYGWLPVADESPLPTYTESFDRPTLESVDSSADRSDAIPLRVKFRTSDGLRTLQIQPDKLYFSWRRRTASELTYRSMKPEFTQLVRRFDEFLVEARLGNRRANLWEVTYINEIPAGTLWQQPSDWHRVLPQLLPAGGVGTPDLTFATYDGNWHFEIAPARGRVHVRVAKMVANQDSNPFLFLRLTARGQFDGPVEGEAWLSGIELGHQACTDLFRHVTSDEAKREWGWQP